jgi:hypothetical protein
MARLFKKIVGKRHPLSFPKRVSKHGLLRLAAKVEIGLKAQLFSFDLFVNSRDYALGCLAQSWRRAHSVRNEHAKEQGDVPLHVLGKRVHDADHIRSQGAFRPLYAGSNFALIDQSSRNYRHTAIIARLVGFRSSFQGYLLTART